MKFMEELSIRKIPGIGSINEIYFNYLGFQKVKDLFEKAVIMKTMFSENQYCYYMKRGLGID